MNITQKARKMAMSFLTMDDILLAQSLIGGGLGQLGRLGISASGPSVAVNIASRTLCLGAEVVTRAASAPLRGDAGNLAGKMGEQARALGVRCSTLAVQGIELAGGKQARNPITKEDWLSKRAAAGYNSWELTADTVFGTLGTLGMMPVSIGRDSLSLSSRWGATARMRKAVDATLDKLPGVSREADQVGLREGLAALALEFGFPLMQTTATLTDAAARLAFSDTRALRDELQRGVARARLLAGLGTESADGDGDGDHERHPYHNSRLQRCARQVAQHPPAAFMAALERGPNGEAPSRVAVLKAMIKDWRALAIFASLYPQMMGFLGTDLMTALVGGAAGHKGAKASGKSGLLGSAATFDILDALVGSAITKDDETPLFPRAAVFLAQDLSFVSQRATLGREAALERIEHLFGERARNRIAGDISLNADLMSKSRGTLASGLRTYIRNIPDAGQLSRQIDLCAERLALLQDSEDSFRLTMTESLTERIDALRLFNSLASCELALRGAPSRGADPEAKSAFFAWASEQN